MALTHQRLLRVSKATKGQIDEWKEGADLHQKSLSGIAPLVLEVACDRWRLAYEHRTHANLLFNRKNPYYRGAISRYYYSMYQALRTCSFVAFGGDDHESHSRLPQNLPGDFPSQLHWQNQLKSAREYRNQADYDPYPKPAGAWRTIALTVSGDANQVLTISRTYLKARGCPLK